MYTPLFFFEQVAEILSHLGNQLKQQLEHKPQNRDLLKHSLTSETHILFNIHVGQNLIFTYYMP
jgi:hypothetical protein